MYVWLQHSKEKKGDWVKKQMFWVFWNNKHISELYISELYEKWIYKNHEYGYTRFEKLRTCFGEVIYTREHKAIATKHKKNISSNINELNVFRKKITNLDEYLPKNYRSNNTNK